MRLQSVDALRTLAIVIMVAVHFLENLAGVTPFVAGLGAPMFVVLSGASFHLWLRAQARRGVDRETITRRAVRRGLFLLGAALAFNVLVWLPEDVFNWDVLSLIGTGLIVLALAREAPDALLLGASALALLLGPVAQLEVDALAYWENPWYDYDWTLGDVLTGYLVAGYFPLLPWIAYPLVGMVVARRVYPEGRADRSRALRTAGIGAALLLAALALHLLGARLLEPEAWSRLGGWRVNPPTLEYTFGSIGLVLLLLGLLAALVDREDAPDSAWRRVTGTFSRASFTLYVLHHLVHVWPLWVVATVRGLPTTELWRQALGPAPSLALAGLFLLLAHPLLRWMERRRIPSIERWMRWTCD
jgi:uncharacterized membrane protein